MKILNTLLSFLAKTVNISGWLLVLPQVVNWFAKLLDWVGRWDTIKKYIKPIKEAVVTILNVVDFAVIDFDYQYLFVNILSIILILLSVYVTFHDRLPVKLRVNGQTSATRAGVIPSIFDDTSLALRRHNGRIPSAFDNDPLQGYSNAERYSLDEAVNKALPLCEKYLNAPTRPQYKSPMQHLVDQLKSQQDPVKQLYQQLLVRGEDKEILRNRSKLKQCFRKQFPEQESFNEEEIFSVVEGVNIGRYDHLWKIKN